MSILNFLGATIVLVLLASFSAYGAHDTLINPQSGAGGAYPQNPTEEYQRESGGYLLNFSSFQYRESDGVIRVKAVVTVKDKTSGNPYKGPLKMVFFKKYLFNTEKVLEKEFEGPFENRYLTYIGFTTDGNFLVRVSFGEDGSYTVEFPLKVGEPSQAYIIIGAVAIVLGAVLVVAYIRKSREKAVSVPAG